MPGIDVGLWNQGQDIYPAQQRRPMPQQPSPNPGMGGQFAPPPPNNPNPSPLRGQVGGIDVGRGFIPGLNFPGMPGGLNFGNSSGPRPLMSNPLPPGYGGSNWGPTPAPGMTGPINAGPTGDPWTGNSGILPLPPSPPPPSTGSFNMPRPGGFTGGSSPGPGGMGGLSGSYGSSGGMGQGMVPGNRPAGRRLFY